MPNFNYKIKNQEISQELRDSYLDYSMSVIVARALPDVRDGLKPVQRRILYAMHKLGMGPQSKFRKCAYVIGDVLGNYHPHGDMAVYDALVRMAQSFSLRYPLIDGQGNFGSVDGDPAAAYRYTEARLTSLSTELLRDIEKNTVDFIPNYDATKTEPQVLPASLPQLLLNGTVGIAVGMATSIPPHNLSEVADALVLLMDNPKITEAKILEIVKGPDFPTGGVIFDKRAIAGAYESGKGSILMRGVAEVIEEKNNLKIVISEIPYQVNKADLISKIAELSLNKKIEGIRDVRDESDKEGLRIVVDLKNNASPQKVLNQLFRFTDLEKNFYVNFLALDFGIQPRTFSLKEVLEAFLEYRRSVIVRRGHYELNLALERAHILEGLAKALDQIDLVIKTIKSSKDKEIAKQNLIVRFKLTEIQAQAILQMQLQTLAALERKKINDELQEKHHLIEELRALLADPKKVLNMIKKETQELKEKYKDTRKTKIVSAAPAEIAEEDLMHKEDILVSLSSSGYIKRMGVAAFRAQRRGGRGVTGMSLKEEDLLGQFFFASSHDRVLFFSELGRVFQAKAYEIPEGKRVSQGKLIQSFLDISKEEKIRTVLPVSAEIEKNKKFLLLVTEKGFIKKIHLENMKNIRRSGLSVIKTKKDDLLKAAILTSGNDEILVVTKKGLAIRFSEKDVRPMGRTAAGVRAIKLKENDSMVGVDAVANPNEAEFLVVSTKGYAKKSKVNAYRRQRRGGGGIRTFKVGEKTGEVSLAKALEKEHEELIVASSKGHVIKLPLKQIPLLSRATQGVRVMKLEEGAVISAAALI